MAWPCAAPADPPDSGFSVTTHSFAFGQAPVFLDDGRVVHAKNYGKGAGQQVYVANFDGSGEQCVTCGTGAPKAPNGVPAAQPKGDWIIFHSWDQRQIKVGSPGFGGLGSALYAVRVDGSGMTQLTGTDAAHGSGEGEDDYHAYWSPDGKQVVWAHLNWNFVTDGGNGRWDVRVADFVVGSDGKPSLRNVRVVRPANGHYYETQWWAPDGSGFLYTESWGTAMNLELFYCKLVDDGRRCEVTRLTNDNAWDEQALFTPDMKRVIFMSSRDRPGFLNSFTVLTEAAGLPADYDYLLILPLFEAGFLQPVGQETTDLYELTLATGAVRRLTHDGDDGWIIPEFTWDPKSRFLMWTEARFPDGLRMLFPLDPVKELQELAAYLGQYQPPSNPSTPGEALPLERRTRIGTFAP
jgi:Tol biopolymer transport system component